MPDNIVSRIDDLSDGISIETDHERRTIRIYCVGTRDGRKTIVVFECHPEGAMAMAETVMKAAKDIADHGSQRQSVPAMPMPPAARRLN